MGVRAEATRSPTRRKHDMQLESKPTVWTSWYLGLRSPKRQRWPTETDRETGELLHVTELVAMDNTGAEVIKVTTAGEPKGVKRQLVTVAKLVATPWNIDDRAEWPSAPT